jgi:hypothetical protein
LAKNSTLPSTRSRATMKSTTAGFPAEFAARARSRAGRISPGSSTFSPWHWQARAMAAKSGWTVNVVAMVRLPN